MHKFGSVEWQNEQTANILTKIALNDEALSPADIAFIEVQTEHLKKVNNEN